MVSLSLSPVTTGDHRPGLHLDELSEGSSPAVPLLRVSAGPAFLQRGITLDVAFHCLFQYLNARAVLYDSPFVFTYLST